jgi:two-component system, chemotaxis family, chemotaxis protein CheY
MIEAAVTSHSYILVADDDATIRRLVVRIINQLAPHATIIIATDGVQAINALASTSFDLIVTDYRMPGATGLDLVAAVRQTDAELPIIMTSADRNVEQTALTAGVTHFLPKPFTIEQFSTLVRSALRLP